VLGVLIAVVSPFIVEQDNRARRRAGLELAVRSFGSGPMHQDESPAAPMLVGVGVLALGIIVLAIRRPDPPKD
jgi:hypothetical protein